MSQHSTIITVHNPSASAPLTASLQGRQAAEVKRHFDFVDDSRVGEIRPNGIGSIGGGQFTWGRRFVLVADRATVISVTSRSSNFIVEELKLVDYTDAGPCWDVARELPAAREGARYGLDAKTRIAIRIDQQDSSLDDAYVNLRQVGDANIAMIQQEERAVFRRTKAASWTAPAVAGDVAPGASRDFLVSDSARLLVETPSADAIELIVANANNLHALHLSTIEDGAERIVSVIPPRAADTSGQWVLTGTNAGRVVVRKDAPCIIAQSPT